MLFNIPIRKRPKVALTFATGIIILGAIFKILHQPYADLTLVAGFFAMVAALIYRIVIKKNKKPKDFVGLVLELSSISLGIFTILHLPYAEIFLYLIPIALIIWVLMGGSIFYYREDDEDDTKDELAEVADVRSESVSLLSVGVFIAACVIIVAGIMLNLRNWPYADHLMFAGFVIAVLCLLKINFSKNG